MRRKNIDIAFTGYMEWHIMIRFYKSKHNDDMLEVEDFANICRTRSCKIYVHTKIKFCRDLARSFRFERKLFKYFCIIFINVHVRDYALIITQLYQFNYIILYGQVNNNRLSKKSCGISASLSLQARSSSYIRRIGSR